MLQIFPQLISIPAQRIQLAVDEFSAVDSAKELGINTSVGARLYLWKRAVEEVPNHLLMGVGREERMESIQRWGDDASSSTIKGLGHLHNNYVHDLFEQGLIGFLGFIAYIIGLSLVAIRFIRYQPTAALGIIGVLVMHSASSFTNVNFAHNYYPTSLSIAVFLCFIILIKRDIDMEKINK
jgi:O-antigen ligase